MKYLLSRKAKRDIALIWLYIANESPQTADRWVSKLQDAFELLAGTPGVGHSRPDLTKQELSFWPVGSYLIVYRVQRGRVQVVAVVHGSRDTRHVLLERGDG